MSEPKALSAEGLDRLMGLLQQRRLEEAMQLFDDEELSYPYVLVMLAELCGALLPSVTGEEREDPEDMWILEPHGPGAFGQHASPPQAMQLVMACANNDQPMIQAHMNAILDDPERTGIAIGKLVSFLADLARLLDEKRS